MHVYRQQITLITSAMTPSPRPAEVARVRVSRVEWEATCIQGPSPPVTEKLVSTIDIELAEATRTRARGK